MLVVFPWLKLCRTSLLPLKPGHMNLKDAGRLGLWSQSQLCEHDVEGTLFEKEKNLGSERWHCRETASFLTVRRHAEQRWCPFAPRD
jgi:hypothetical protein